MASELDNPAWHALSGPHSDLAERSADGVVARYPRDVSPFAAVDVLEADAWRSLRTYFGHRAVVIARAEPQSAPAGWEQLFAESLTQYVADSPDPVPDVETVELGAADVDEMIALTKSTEPGPFFERTHLLGHYIGVRRNGELVAMAGERLRTDRWAEISAVCVAESARRQGLGGALTTQLVHMIRGRGIEAMLHVRDGNDPAHALYRRIGFRKRTEVTVTGWRWIGDSSS